ncbi:unnamed protein product [Durusdinium trenchii]|uniref:Uncharacterized protein n=1 Tax=Durusdinium trenchii TaxID=1381693 RepID=A0ABP0HS35_9DINO
MVSQLNRRLFRALQPVEIVSWHQLGATTHRTFLRELTDRLLLGEGVGGEHRFDRDRVYWFSRPEVPGWNKIAFVCLVWLFVAAKVPLKLMP